MTTPVRARTDALVVGVMGSSLSQAGFRKRGRTWWADEPGVRRCVTYAGHWSNTATTGVLAVGLGASDERLSHDLSAEAVWDRSGIRFTLERLGIEPGARLGWDIPDTRDSAGEAELRMALEQDWLTHGLPLLRASATPESLGNHIADTGNTETVWLAVDQIARPLRDDHLLQSLARRGLAAGRSRQRWRYAPGDDHPLELGLTFWEWALRLADETEVAVTSADLAAAAAVLEDAAQGCLLTEWHTGSQEAAARYLGERLGRAMPTFAAMTRHNATL